MKIKLGDSAVSEMVGAILLLAIAICVASGIYMQVLSNPDPGSEVNVTIVGKLESGNVVFELRRGESLKLGTKVILSFGDIEYPFIIGEDPIISDEDKSDGYWNIGERLVYSGFNLTNLEVKCKIIDPDSNSIVMWGTLQEGITSIISGGIWHFDENQGYIAHDSLGLDDYGILMPDTIIGPYWSSITKQSGNSSLRFDGINDYIRVDGHYISLDITDKLTIDAYMQIPKSMILDHYSFAPDFGYNPKILKISENVYAIVYRGQEFETDPEKKLGVLKTVKIFDDGTISFDIINSSFVFWGGNAQPSCWPEIIHVYEDLYLISYYIDSSYNGYLNTVKIAENGSITKQVIGSFLFNNDVNEPDIIHINDSICAVIYRDDPTKTKGYGFLKTINITNNGQNIDFVNINGNSFEFDQGLKCSEPDIINVAGNIYAIAYSGNNNTGVLSTIKIFNDGHIDQNIIDSFNFDTINDSYNPQLFRISNNIFGLVYYDNNPAGDGFVTTVEISDTGIITKPAIDNSKFEDDYCLQPYVTYLHDDYYSIAYCSSSSNDGALTTIEIGSDGKISNNPPKKLIFTDTTKNYFGKQCHLTHVSGDIVAIVFSSGSYSGQPHQGHLITFNSLADIPENPPPDSNIPYTSGIYKDDAYGVFLNRNYIGASIGNNFFLKEVNITPDIWYHVNLTYDGQNIKLYLDSVLEISDIATDTIPHSTNDIIIGRKFFGYIDEVKILPYVLT